MDTNKLKRFATEARKILMQGVAHRLSALGFQPDGTTTEEPQQLGGGATFMGKTVSQDFYDKWQSLRHAVGERGLREVAEEAAYTWFNRLVAIRIMAKNGLASPVVEYESEEIPIPLLVSEARQGRMPEMDADSRSRLAELLDDDSKTSEQFAILIVAYCHQNPIIHQCFGRITDYTELLLPTNILNEGGFVRMLNQTEFIADQDYRSPELIGWLYQFYIAERKDEVFAKKGKFEADEIPAATQIFTPNWIVKYMVQNTIGRIYLDNNPYETTLSEKWNYLVDNLQFRIYNLECTRDEEPAPAAPEIINSKLYTINCPAAPEIINSKLSIINYTNLEELKVGDLACGSGHILNECFDLLFQLYMAEGYGRTKAIESIFRHNLTGIDLDTRAKQLAQFALLLKACQKDPTFADGHCLPRVLDMPHCNRYTWRDASGHFATHYQLSPLTDGEELDRAFQLLEQANDLGSIMKFDISSAARLYMQQSIQAYEAAPAHAPHFAPLIQGFRLILALTEKYHALVMNPPYMGGGNMNAVLAKYVKDNYEEGKADLATVFVQMMSQRTMENGSYAFIIPPSWMFLSTFERLRKQIIDNDSIQSLLHLSRGVFGADFGASSAVIQRAANKEARGTYFRLVERTFQEFEQSHLRMLFEQTLANHDFKYRFKDYTKDVTALPYSEDGQKIYYPNVRQQDFEKIPGCPIGYWVSEKMIEAFSYELINTYATPRAGLATGDNNTFQRLWHEVSFQNIGFNVTDCNETLSLNTKWYPCLSGGRSRKWGNHIEYIVNWQNNGYDLKHFVGSNGKLASRPQNTQFYFKEGLTWNKISSNEFCVRYKSVGSIFDDTSRCAFVEERDRLYFTIGLLCSKVSMEYLKIFNPTMSFTNGDINRIPLIFANNYESIDNIVEQNISISKQDWDAHETSWDFEENPLLAVDTNTYMENLQHETEQQTGEPLHTDPAPPQLDSLQWRMEQYKKKWEHLFMQLHANEEELNRQFIQIYGLQDELSPNVPLQEITILQQGEISIED